MLPGRALQHFPARTRLDDFELGGSVSQPVVTNEGIPTGQARLAQDGARCPSKLAARNRFSLLVAAAPGHQLSRRDARLCRYRGGASDHAAVGTARPCRRGCADRSCRCALARISVRSPRAPSVESLASAYFRLSSRRLPGCSACAVIGWPRVSWTSRDGSSGGRRVPRRGGPGHRRSDEARQTRGWPPTARRKPRVPDGFGRAQPVLAG